MELVFCGYYISLCVFSSWSYFKSASPRYSHCCKNGQQWNLIAKMPNISSTINITYFLFGLLLLSLLFFWFFWSSLLLSVETFELFNFSLFWPFADFLEDPPPRPLTFHLNMVGGGDLDHFFTPAKYSHNEIRLLNFFSVALKWFHTH